jgi:hypothetical protein
MFWLSNRLLKQLPILIRPTRRLLHPSALSLPGQPLCPRTHLVPGKAAVNYRFIRGGWDDPNCARRTSTFLSCAFREQKDGQASLPILLRPRVARAQKTIRLHPLLCSGRTRAQRVSFRYPLSCAMREQTDRRQVVTC